MVNVARLAISVKWIYSRESSVRVSAGKRRKTLACLCVSVFTDFNLLIYARAEEQSVAKMESHVDATHVPLSHPETRQHQQLFF